MEIAHYPYKFVQKIEEPWDGPQGFLLYKLLYSFKSPKTHQVYWVLIEVYKYHFYAIKFHLKAHRDSERKYNVMTGLNEARQCVQTCMVIMHEVAASDERSSFGFIGANAIGESELETKRFRVYSRYMQTYFSKDKFEHHYNLNKSAYIILRRKELSANPELLSEIVKGFKTLYPYFD